MQAKITKENGDVEKVKIRNWDFYFRMWPMALALVSCVFWFGGLVTSRMETPEQKLSRILQQTGPMKVRIERLESRLESHRSFAGHREMIERVNQLTEEVDHLHNEVDRLHEKLRKR